MREITTSTENDITVKGDGIEYTISRSALLVHDLKIEPTLMATIEQNLDQLSRIDPRSAGTVQAFKENLKNGRLSMRERGGYGWLNSWCYTKSDRSYGRGKDYINGLEQTLFGFRLGEKVWGEQNGQRLDPGFDHIFKLAVKEIQRKFGKKPG